MTTFTVTHHFDHWPFGEWGPVTFFAPVGKFHPSKWGKEWRVCVVGEPNKHGGPPPPHIFATESEALAFIQNHPSAVNNRAHSSFTL